MIDRRRWPHWIRLLVKKMKADPESISINMHTPVIRTPYGQDHDGTFTIVIKGNFERKRQKRR